MCECEEYLETVSLEERDDLEVILLHKFSE